MDWGIFWTIIGASIAIVGLIYSFLRNFKQDINSHIDRVEKRIDTVEKKFEIRMHSIESRMNSVDERLFFMLTGKNIADAIIEEQIKRSKL